MVIKAKTVPANLELKGKRVFLRADINVPLSRDTKGRVVVADDTRIRNVISTIERLTSRGAKVIVASHLGRPQGKVVSDLRMKPVSEALSVMLSSKAGKFIAVTSWDFKRIRNAVESLQNKDVLILENLRFNSEEESNDKKFAKSLADLADIYINEAFAVSHRKQASLIGVPKYLPSYAGWALLEELVVLEKIRTNPKKPFVLVVGGAKVPEKAGMIMNLSRLASVALVGGVTANTLLKLAGVPVGKSLVNTEKSYAPLKKFLKMKKRIPGIGMVPFVHLPIDVVVAQSPADTPRLVDLSRGEKVKRSEIIYDVGPKTVQRFSSIIKKAKTIVWSGTMGMFEKRQFAQGSLSVAWLIAARSSGSAFGLAGGGETLKVLKDTGMADYMDYLATGGGAMLKVFSGKELPAVMAIEKSQAKKS